jgi:hypothetical protein
MNQETTHPITKWLSKQESLIFSLYAISAAFSCYFCMYAFRKPYTAIGYAGYEDLWGLDYKIALILAQLFGYTLSKFLGIKVISELDPKWRPIALLGFIGIAELSLVGFALTPPSYGPIFMFINGLPLGMIWGLVFGFLEGRKLTEVLGAGLSASYIIASGFVKSAGRGLMDWGVDDRWMPAATGVIFLIPFLVCVYLLYRLPPPTKEDEALRTKRVPMDAAARMAFIKQSALGLGLLTTLYIFLTAYRDFRDNFAAEIWAAIGYGDTPEIFTISELPIAFTVLVTLALLVKIKDNRRAMLAVHMVMMSGCALIGGSTLLFELGAISGAAWMITVGLGAYLAYVPYGSMLFDRLLAALGSAGTAGFMIYVTDAFGYVGSIGINLYKNFGGGDISWRNFFVQLSYFTSVFCTVCFIGSMIYFSRRAHLSHDNPPPSST